MSSEINTMSELQRQILHYLMAGWQTMDEAKESGFVRLSELSNHFGVRPDEMRKQLALLETFGYVDNVHSMGMDQTEYYRGLDQVTKRTYDPDDPTYFITENGKRLVLADTMSDEGSSASTA